MTSELHVTELPDLTHPYWHRPTARGWIHFYSAIAAAIVGITLVVIAATQVNTAAAIVCGAYAVAIVALFATSATFHLHYWSTAKAYAWMKRADHSMIFLFIAGTYTALALLSLPSTSGQWVLWVVWSGSAAGIALKIGWPGSPRWLGVPIYIALGSMVVFIFPELLDAGGATPVVLICVGGLLYIIGAVMYALRQPNIWPRTFGHHEVFHGFVSLAALCHCLAIWLLLLR